MRPPSNSVMLAKDVVEIFECGDFALYEIYDVLLARRLVRSSEYQSLEDWDTEALGRVRDRIKLEVEIDIQRYLWYNPDCYID